MPDLLVLGADGFIGSHVTRELLRRGHTVRAFGRFSGGTPRNLEPHSGLELHAGDFRNRHDLAAALRGVRQVLHLISTTTPATSGADPAYDVETNVRGTIDLLDGCVAEGVERVLFASTGGAIYGHDPGRPLREADATRPISPYAVGKQAVEGYLRFYRQAHGLESVTLRISNPFGERQAVEGAQGAIPIFLRNILDGRPLTVFGDGSMIRDYIYVSDLACMVAEVTERNAHHDVYNVGSGIGVSVNQIVDLVGLVSGSTPTIVHQPLRPTDVQTVVLDTARFTAEFRARPETSLAEGIERTWDYVKRISEGDQVAR